MSNTILPRRCWYFIRVSPDTDGVMLAQLWAVNARSREAAEMRLQVVLSLHIAGGLTQTHLERAEAFPGTPAHATERQIAITQGVPYAFHGFGPVIPRPPLSGQPPHPSLTGHNETSKEINNAHPEGSTEAGH